jgi:hypothetical protein
MFGRRVQFGSIDVGRDRYSKLMSVLDRPPNISSMGVRAINVLCNFLRGHDIAVGVSAFSMVEGKYLYIIASPFKLGLGGVEVVPWVEFSCSFRCRSY